jgi:hypothetical protein
MDRPLTSYDAEENYQLPLLTPSSSLPSNHTMSRTQPLVLLPESFLHPPTRPVSFARGRPATVPKMTSGNLFGPYPSESMPRSNPHPFTSSTAYNAYARSLQPLGPSPRQQTHLVTAPDHSYGMQRQESGYGMQAGPSRLGENALSRSGDPRVVATPSRDRTASTSTAEKPKFRKKQGPSVKRTEVGMACQFCRRRSVALEVRVNGADWFVPFAFWALRKIRCSGEKPCKNCMRLNKECVYLPVSATTTPPSRGKKRQRSTEDGEGS